MVEISGHFVSPPPRSPPQTAIWNICAVVKPAKILGLDAGKIKKSGIADIVIFDPNEEWIVDATRFKSKARNTPFDGTKLRGKVKYAISRGEIVYRG